MLDFESLELPRESRRTCRDNRQSHAHTYLRVLRRWWWLPILLGVISAGVTYAGTKALIKPEYGASVTIRSNLRQRWRRNQSSTGCQLDRDADDQYQVEYFVQRAIDNCTPSGNPVDYCAAKGDPACARNEPSASPTPPIDS